MTDKAQQESISRLERLRAKWDFDMLKEAIDLGAPVLKELNLADADQAKAMLDTEPNQLEAAFDVPPMQLEAIVKVVGRPPLPVRNGEVQGKTNLTKDFPAGIDLKITAVEPLLSSVGRIEFVNHDMAWGGTGWVIREEDDGSFLIVTNRHVAKLVARRTWRGDGVYMLNWGNARFGAKIDFLKEDGRMADESRQLPLEKFTYIAEDLAADIALARIPTPAGFSISHLPLAADDGEHGELMAVCGYPASDGSRNDVSHMERYFKGLYDVKRFSPGFLDMPTPQSQLSHDATTTGGSSGSPVISLKSKKVIGLHFAGLYGDHNSAVRVSTLKALLDKGATGAMLNTGGRIEGRDGSHDADHFEGRTGYDPDFLQVEPVPLPKPSNAIPLSQPSDAPNDSPHELRYQHFSILYSGAVKSPIITALNIDGSRTRAVKDYSRWCKDLRIPAEEQLSQEEYGHDDIDRGHLIRRAATNWGNSEDVANLSNRDSYHYTVASPQHRLLNRNRHTWLGLENYIMYSARTHRFRACVFTGPVFSDDDPQLGNTVAPVPLQYFKVVVMAAPVPEEDGIVRLHATAYLISQGQLIHKILSDRGRVEATEGFTFEEYNTFQIRIRDLEAETGHDFGTLRDADPLEKIEAVSSGQAVALTIHDLEDVRL